MKLGLRKSGENLETFFWKDEKHWLTPPPPALWFNQKQLKLQREFAALLTHYNLCSSIKVRVGPVIKSQYSTADWTLRAAWSVLAITLHEPSQTAPEGGAPLSNSPSELPPWVRYAAIILINLGLWGSNVIESGSYWWKCPSPNQVLMKTKGSAEGWRTG